MVVFFLLFQTTQLSFSPLLFTPSTSKVPSQRKAIFLSLLVPGLGESYLKEKDKAIRSYIIEGCIWAYFLGLRWYGSVLERDSKLYAQGKAKAYKGGDDEYYDIIEEYMSLEDYHLKVRERARKLYPDTVEGVVEKREEYFKQHAYPQEWRWEWRTKEELFKYKEIRGNMREYFHRSTFCIGIAILNRLLSVITITQMKGKNYGLEIKPTRVEFYYSLSL